MLQRLIAAVLGVLGLAAIALGIASATAWRADDTVTATGRSASGTTLVTTAPGVLELGDPPVTVTATAADGSPVVLAVGRDTDVTGWIGTDAHTVVTGLSDWRTLATDEVTAPAPSPEPSPTPAADAAPAPTQTPAEPAEPAEPAAVPAPDPTGSDLWVDEVTGAGSAELVWTPRDGRWTLLAASTGEDAGPVTLTLSWPQTVTTPWLVPLVVGGVVLLLLAALLALRARRAGRRADEWHPVVTGATPAVAGSGATALDPGVSARTRRERRDAAAAAAAATAAARQDAKGAPRTGETATVDPPSGPTPVAPPSSTGPSTAPAATDDASASPSATAATVPPARTGAAEPGAPAGSGASRQAPTGEVPVTEGVARSAAAPDPSATVPADPATVTVVPGATPAAGPASPAGPADPTTPVPVASADTTPAPTTAPPTTAPSGTAPSGTAPSGTATHPADDVAPAPAAPPPARPGGLLRSLRRGGTGAPTDGPEGSGPAAPDAAGPGAERATSSPGGAGVAGPPPDTEPTGAAAAAEATSTENASSDVTGSLTAPEPPEPSGASGRRADAWRRAWGFRGSDTGPAPADPAASPDPTTPPGPNPPGSAAGDTHDTLDSDGKDAR